MTVSLAQIGALLSEAGVQHEHKENYLMSTMSVGQDETTYGVAFFSRMEGTVFEAACLGIIPTEKIASSEHKGIFMMYLLDVAWNTAFGTPELDKRDGELRLLVELPLADAQMTSGQIKLIVEGLMRQAVRIRAQGTQVLETGRLPEPPAAAPAANNDDQAAMARLSVLQLIQTARGREQARALLSDPANPEFLRAAIRGMLPLMAALDQVGDPS